MRVPSSYHGRSELDVPMTPMIDVVFQLLIFFICTASFQMAEDLLPTSLAATSGTSTAAPKEDEPSLEQIVVRGLRVNGQTEWIVNERRCTSTSAVADVLRAIASIDATLPVILDVAPEVPIGEMIDVYDTSRVVGLQKIQFAAQP